ncbi:MAG: META domain-containing protein [Actinobacteria bacterium]|nr:META domain-containing protein [Actinomycetota bacterium]
MIEIDGTTWILGTLDGRPPLPGTDVTLSFEGGAAFGSDGCNRYRASYELGEDGRLAVGPAMATTLMVCAEDVMAQAAAYGAALRAAASARLLDDGALALAEADGTVRITFTAQDTALEGTDWRVTAYNNGRQAVVSVLVDTELTVSFGDGMVSGSAGCNRYRASFESDGRRVAVGPALSTRRICSSPEGVMEQEAAFLQALEWAAVSRRA